jgi:hypothetical protein
MDKQTYTEEDNTKLKKTSCTDLILGQSLNSYSPSCDIKCALICNFVLASLFIALGVPIVVLSGRVIEHTVDYSKW